jgi:predicted GTPase
MNRLKWWWLGILTIFSIPYLLLFAAGSVWLYQYHVLWLWFVIALLCTLAVWPLVIWMRRKSLAAAERAAAEPAPQWPPAASAPWQAINGLAERLQSQDLSLNQPERWWPVLYEVLQTVARHYHPQSSQPELEIPVPHVLRVVELVAVDLRRACSRHVPGAHFLTLHDLKRLARLAALSRRLYFLYRVVQLPINPLAAVLREVRDFSADKLTGASADDFKRWAVGFCVRRAGYYAIELYSGNLVLDDVEFRGYQTRHSRRDVQRAEARQERLAEEPLRILVAGQVKAGKSALINALFDAPQAAVDVVPRTRGVTPYVLQREGIPRGVILDTAGYADLATAGTALRDLGREARRCDLILLVCSARSAAREADRSWLDQLRSEYQGQPNRIPPPVVVVLSNIDQLRPLAEWNPPYDLRRPTSAKARQIVEAIEAVAADLAVDVGRIVPVCLAAEKVYNVDEALVPALSELLPEAQRAKYLRCLRSYHREQYWQQLWQQAIQSGRLLWKEGSAWLGK